MMEWLDTASLLHLLVSVLGWPTHVLLGLGLLLGLWEVGLLVGERFWGLPRIRDLLPPRKRVHDLARRRIERADTLARIGPMLGLMGTLIPLGPGLAALGRGDVSALAAAVTVAFDTTVVGLLIGILGFVVGKLRRRYYDGLLDELEGRSHA